MGVSFLWVYRFSFFFWLIGFGFEIPDEGIENEGCNVGGADIEISDEEPPEVCNEESCGYDMS